MQKTLLLVANYDSAVGYAWWLVESFWVLLAKHYNSNVGVVLAYPSITTLPETIAAAPLKTVKQDLTGTGPVKVLSQCRFLARHKVRAVYFSDQPTWHWRYLLFRLFGVRLIIVHDHTPGLRTRASGYRAWLKRLIHRWPLFSADGFIGATEFVCQRMIEVNGVRPDRCFAAPNGLPKASNPTGVLDLHDRFHIPGERKVIVMTARANRYKGVDSVLACMSRLLARGRSDVHFLFVGDGPHLESFKNAAREKGVLDWCSFPGRLEDVPSLLEGADIAIHPSRGEVGYCLAILEYMRAGLPVVVPDNPSVSGATEHEVNGLLYSEGDVEAAADILEKLLDDSALREKLGTRASIDAQTYSLEATHRALLNAFEKIDKRKVLEAAPEGRT